MAPYVFYQFPAMICFINLQDQSSTMERGAESDAHVYE